MKRIRDLLRRLAGPTAPDVVVHAKAQEALAAADRRDAEVAAKHAEVRKATTVFLIQHNAMIAKLSERRVATEGRNGAHSPPAEPT